MLIPNRKLLFDQLTDRQYVNTTWVATPEVGTTLDEMSEPMYWSTVANKLHAGDRIEVCPKDGSFWAELLVQVVEPLTVKVFVLRAHEFIKNRDLNPQVKLDVPDGYEVKHVGARGWCAQRKADREFVVEGCKDRDETIIKLIRHVQRVSA